MKAIHIVNIKSKDLNLLMVFDAVMRDLNVSRAAKRLALSQPALSNALVRLRRDFDDELFVRSGRGMTATPRALALKAEIAAVVEKAGKLYAHPRFEPAFAKGRFTMATTDYFEALALPSFLAHLRAKAPGFETVIRPLLGILPKAELESGMLDVAVAGYFGELPEGFHQQRIYDETYTCVVRKGHPAIKAAGGKLTLDAFVAMDHILVSPQGDLMGAVDRALAKVRKRRRIVAAVANFYSPAPIVATSDCIATVPSRLAASYGKVWPLDQFEPPLPVPGFCIAQVWHARTHGSPEHVWLRDTLYAVLKDI